MQGDAQRKSTVLGILAVAHARIFRRRLNPELSTTLDAGWARRASARSWLLVAAFVSLASLRSLTSQQYRVSKSGQVVSSQDQVRKIISAQTHVSCWYSCKLAFQDRSLPASCHDTLILCIGAPNSQIPGSHCRVRGSDTCDAARVSLLQLERPYTANHIEVYPNSNNSKSIVCRFR